MKKIKSLSVMNIAVKYPYESVRWAFMKWADIPDATNPNIVYLRRLRIIQTPWGGIYLHFIYIKDHDRDPHDHPMNFTSLVLRGGYTEERWRTRMYSTRYLGTRIRRRFSLARTSTVTAHMITELKPRTVTILLVGPRRREWGFWTDAGFTPWREYVEAKGGSHAQS